MISSPLLFLLVTLPLSAPGSPLESRLKGFDTVQVYQLSGQSRSRRAIHQTLREDDGRLMVIVDGPTRSWTLSLWHNRDLIAPGFTMKHFNKQTGEEIVTEDAHNCYYHGKVVDISDSHVVLSTCSGLRGLVYDGKETFHIQPSELTPDGFTHVVFQLDDMKDRQFHRTCGNTNKEIVPSIQDVFKNYRVHLRRPHIKRRAPTEYIVELIIVMDNRAYQRLNSNATQVKEYCGQVANTVDSIYKRLDMGFRIALIHIEFWSAEDRIQIHEDAREMLDQFTDYVHDSVLKSDTLPHPDSTQFITGIDFNEDTVGMAHIKTMCSGASSSGVNMFSFSPEELASVMAHEMGHTFGLTHDDDRNNCVCPDPHGCIMSASSSGPVRNYNFSECSKSDLITNLESGLGHCLYNMPTRLYSEPVCGNGFKEAGEECDCGQEDECAINDPCCQPGKCLLKETSSCGEGDCCQDCQFKMYGVKCRDAVNDCDFPEYCSGESSDCPRNIYKQDGSNCTDAGHMGYCYQATCQTHESQCATLWGPGGTDAPEICYSRINIQGSQFGHCGQTGKDSYVACQPSDVRCGKLQCSANNRSPVIGFATHISSYRFSGVSCRGASVSLGDDVPDPGMVQDGTKCDENKICLSNQCVSLSSVYADSLYIQMCPGNTIKGVCSGNGVCTNINQCYCNKGWAPPLCNEAGRGGIEGFPGPMDDEGSSNTGAIVGGVIGVIVVIVLVVVIVYFCRGHLGTDFMGKSPKHNNSSNTKSSRDSAQPPLYSNATNHLVPPTSHKVPPGRPANPPPARPANPPPARPANPPPARPASPPSKTLATNNSAPTAALKMSPGPTNRQPPVVRPAGKPPGPPSKPAPPAKPAQPARLRSLSPVAGAKPVLPAKPKS